MTGRPPGIEWVLMKKAGGLGTVPHGTPLLSDGRIGAALRDASFLARPDVHKDKQKHIIVASHHIGIGGGAIELAAACDTRRILINDDLMWDAAEVSAIGRCRRPGCRTLFQLAEREADSVEHIRSYYGLAVYGGMQVKHAGRPGVIVGYAGQYIRVLLDGDKHPVTCHPTANMEYPDGTRVGPGPDERFAHLVEVQSA